METIKRELVFKGDNTSKICYIPYLNGIELPFVAGVVIKSTYSELMTAEITIIIASDPDTIVRVESINP